MGCVTVQILRYGLFDCADPAVWVVRVCRYCGISCVIVEILRYELCDCADTTVWGA